MDETDVRQLSKNPLFLLHSWLKTVEIYDTIDSTMDHPPRETPGLVIALEQTRGRGRTGPWVSTRGGAWLTVFLDAKPFKGLTLATGGCLAHRLESLTGKTGFMVKWPNDVYTVRGKLAGILVEYGRGLLRVGVGVNVFNTPPSNGDNLYNAGYRGSLAGVYLAIILAVYNAVYNSYQCIQEARRRSMLRNRIVHVVREDGATVVGRVLDYSDDGALVVDRNGVVERIYCCHVARVV